MHPKTLVLAMLASIGCGSPAPHPEPVVPNQPTPAAPVPQSNAEVEAALSKRLESADLKEWLDTVDPKRTVDFSTKAADVSALVGTPIDGEQVVNLGMPPRLTRRLDLRTLQGRIDSVVMCLSMGRTDCDLNGIVDPGEALSRSAGATPTQNASPYLDDDLNWRGLVDVCTNPGEGTACGSAHVLDGHTAGCLKDRPCRYGRPYGDVLSNGGTTSAEAWADIARAEHASVASFARHVHELLSVGAPLELVRAAVHAQADEISHTERAIAVTRHLGGDVTLPPLPALPARAGLFEILRAVATEGCVAESASLLAAASALREVTDPIIAEHLSAIIDDELAHATLAWRTLAWGLPQLEGSERSEILGLLRSHIVSGPSAPRGSGILDPGAARTLAVWSQSELFEPAVQLLAGLHARERATSAR